MLVSQCSEIVKNSFHFVAHTFLCCDVNMNAVKSGLIPNGVVANPDNYDERNVVFNLNTATSHIVERVYADHAFGLSKTKRFSLTWLKEEKKFFWIAQVLVSIHLLTRTNEKMSRKFSSVRCFEMRPPIDTINRF